MNAPQEPDQHRAPATQADPGPGIPAPEIPPAVLANLSAYQLAVEQAHAYLHRVDTKEYSDLALRWMVENLLILGPTELDLLLIYLQGNEQAIATGDYGMGILHQVFTRMIGKEPRP